MAILLFSLRGVPEDEAYEIRELLSEHEINFYETTAGNWCVSMPALWLRNDVELAKAQQLFDTISTTTANQPATIIFKTQTNRTSQNVINRISGKTTAAQCLFSGDSFSALCFNQTII